MPCSINRQLRAPVMTAMALSFTRPQSRAMTFLVAVDFLLILLGSLIAAAATATSTTVLLIGLAVKPILFPFVKPSPWVEHAKSGATPSVMT